MLLLGQAGAELARVVSSEVLWGLRPAHLHGAFALIRHKLLEV